MLNLLKKKCLTEILWKYFSWSITVYHFELNGFLKKSRTKEFFSLQQLCTFIKNLKKSYVSNPLSGCVITWLGLLHMDNLAVLWDKILMFNLKNHGCALEIINTKPHKGTQTQNNYSTLSFVLQMFQTIWQADSAVCNRLANDSRVWRMKSGKKWLFGGCFHLCSVLVFHLLLGVCIL